MAAQRTVLASTTLPALAPSFRRSLEAANKSPKTVKTYTEAVELFMAFLKSEGMPLGADNVRREHVEAFIVDMLQRWKPATANNRYRGLQQFFRWLQEEGEIKASPMINMRPPVVPEQSVPVLTDEQVKALLRTCEGKDFDSRRDAAIIRLFLDTGMRRAELSGLRLEDVDLDHHVAVVMGKGRRPRGCAFGRKTALALDRYLRVRAMHRDAELPALWLGHAGPMTDSGVSQAVEKRADLAGLEHLNVHKFRHSFAHAWLSNGGNEGDLMMLAGWKSRTMLSRYAASAAVDRAREAHKRMALGDRL
jgi:site-specific recombinase XerD